MIYLISGLKNSGKTETSKMLQFCLYMPKWLCTYSIYKNFYNILKFLFPKNIYAFGDPVKECLSIITTFPREKFDDRVFKEGQYFRCNGYGFSMRTLMQKFGTEIIQTNFGKDIWAYIISNRIFKDRHRDAIISDLRFKAEYGYFSDMEHTAIFIYNPKCEEGTHSSEKECLELLQEKKFDAIIDNIRDLDYMFNQIKDMV